MVSQAALVKGLEEISDIHLSQPAGRYQILTRSSGDNHSLSFSVTPKAS